MKAILRLLSVAIPAVFVLCQGYSKPCQEGENFPINNPASLPRSVRYAKNIRGAWQWTHNSRYWGGGRDTTIRRADTAFSVTLENDTIARVGSSRLFYIPPVTNGFSSDTSKVYYSKNSDRPGGTGTNEYLIYDIKENALQYSLSTSGSGGGAEEDFYRK